MGPGFFIVPLLEPLWPLSAKCLMLSSVRGCTEVRVCGKARSPGERRVGGGLGKEGYILDLASP